MDPTKQRIAIAEIHGRQGVLPDYLNDLNAMHEAIMAQPQEVRARINFTLAESFRPKKWILDQAINATAAQRAEAFLKTLNLWK